MKKRFRFKPLIIAAAVTAAAAASALTVNALSVGENPVFKINNKTVDAYFTSYTDECGHEIEIYMVEYPEEVVYPFKGEVKKPVGNLRVKHSPISGSDERMDSIELVDEEGNKLDSSYTYGKYFEAIIHADKDSSHIVSYSQAGIGGGLKDGYNFSATYRPADKSLSLDFHRSLFDTIADAFKGE